MIRKSLKTSMQSLQTPPLKRKNPASLFIQTLYKSTGAGRPKKKLYHRVRDLDKVMDLQKKPSLILHLKSIILNQKSHSILLRDLEKEVGFVKKWDFMAVIEKYPSIFQATGGNTAPISVKLTHRAAQIAAEEPSVRESMEPIVVRNLRKLLMMSMDCRIPLGKIEFVESELGLPPNFKKSLVPKYPELFSVIDVNGVAYLNLENWDSALAVTVREEKLGLAGDSWVGNKSKKLARDGNFFGPFAFKLNYSPGFRPNTTYLEEVWKWQKLQFPSPYLNGRTVDFADPRARKRAVAVLHEVLSLTMEKRLSSAQLDVFHAEYQLPSSSIPSVEVLDSAREELTRLFSLHRIIYDLSFLESIVPWVLERVRCPVIEHLSLSVVDKKIVGVGRLEVEDNFTAEFEAAFDNADGPVADGPMLSDPDGGLICIYAFLGVAQQTDRVGTSGSGNSPGHTLVLEEGSDDEPDTAPPSDHEQVPLHENGPRGPGVNFVAKEHSGQAALEQIASLGRIVSELGRQVSACAEDRSRLMRQLNVAKALLKDAGITVNWDQL